MGPRSLRPAAALLALLAALVMAGGASPGTSGDEPRREILVGFEPGVSAAAQRDLLTSLGASPSQRFRTVRAFLATVSADRRAAVIAALERDPRVRYAEPNVRFRIDGEPNDSSFGDLWGLSNSGQTVNGLAGVADADIDAPEAWEVTTGSAGVTVAVIDTGVDYSHPDLAANIWVNPGENCSGCRNDQVDNDGNGYVDDWRGWDFLNNDNDPFDDNGHGTHVAGTIGAIGNDGRGVAGVNWTVKIMPLKFLGANGSGDAADAVRAVLYATSMGAAVTNNSWGGDGYSQTLADAIAQADARGSLFVAAAGNSLGNNDTSPNYPSNYDIPNVIAVAATDQSDARAWFSNYGRRSVDLGAPGTNILSTQPGGGYAFLDGTSMAAPHVTGAVALARAAFPSATPVGLKALFFRTVDANASLATRTATGGRLNVGDALACSGTPQLWLEEPRPGFSVDVGDTISVRVLAGSCGDPAGVAVGVTANGVSVGLDDRGDGYFAGSFTATEAGGITVDATASAGAATDTQTALGSATQVYPILPGGDAVTVTTTVPEENARLVFDGVAGRRVSLKLTGVTIGTSGSTSAKVSILNPNGTALVSPTYFGTSGGFVDTKTLPATGKYAIVIDPQGTATGSATLTLYDVPPDVSATISAGGEDVTVSPDAPGQNARVTFPGAAGQTVSLKLSDVTIGSSSSSSGKVSILNPNGTTLVSPTFFGTSGGFVDAKSLPSTGTYTILIDPQSNALGSATLTLYDVPPDTSATISADGEDVTVASDAPGQNARATFSGAAGRRISLELRDVTIGSSSASSAKVSILNPNGTALVTPTFFGTSGSFVDVKTLPSTGTYTILVDPQSNAVGSATLRLHDVPPDAAASIVPGGAPVGVSVTVPGQNARLTFSGTAGRRISLKLSDVTIGSASSSSARISILNPNGTALVSPTYFGTSGGFVDAKSLPSSGTYTILVDPQSTADGGATVTLYDVPPDAATTLVVGGPSSTLSMSVPGQNGTATFSGTAGQRVTLRLTSVSIGTSSFSSAKVSVLTPSGTTLLSPTFFGTSGKTIALTLASSGTHTIVVDPQAAATGSATLSLTSP